MKKVIEIIKEKIETGNHDVNLANYKSHASMPIAGWKGEVPSIGDVLTDGNQEMTVRSYVVYGDEVGIQTDTVAIPASQVIDMMTKKICWVK